MANEFIARKGIIALADSTISGSLNVTGTLTGDGSGLTGVVAVQAPGGSDGQLQYNNGGTTAGTAGLYWDDVNNRLGIGTTSPAHKLHVDGDIISKRTASTTAKNGQFLVYSDLAAGGYLYGMDLGYTGTTSRFRTRIFSPASYDVAISSAPSTSMNSQSDYTDHVVVRGDSGNVGIGTSSPTYRLTVAGSNGDFGVGSTGNDLYFTRNGANYFYATGASSSFRFFTAGVEKLNIGNTNSYFPNGNVGIGTTAPSSKLHIVTGTPTGAIAPSSDVPLLIDSSGNQFIEFRTTSAASGLMQGTLYSDNGKNAFIGYKEYTGAVAGTYGESVHIAVRDFSASDAGSGIYLGSTSNPSLGVTTPHMFIKGSGNVGIGTTSPSQKLAVIGNVIAGAGAADNYFEAVHSDGSSTRMHGYGLFMGRTSSYIRPTTDNTHALYIGTDGNQWSTINIDSSTTLFKTNGVEHMRITSGGNVGIGTTSPTTTLDVAGSGTISGDLTVGGTITAQEFRAEFITNTIILESGSTQFGDSADDTHTFTGSVNVSGPLKVVQGATDQTYTADTTSLPDTTGAEFLRIEGNYTDGRYTHEWTKVDRGGNLPLYLRESKGTANAFSNLARFGNHSNSPYEFEVFGDINATGNLYDSGNAVWHAGNFNPSNYLTTSGKAADSELLDGLDSTSFLRSDTNDTFSGNLQVASATQTDSTTKAEMLTNAAFRIKPHVLNSGTLAFAQVDNGSSIGMQFTNGAGTADWDISMQPFGGNVGIGTTSPTYKLDVNGEGRYKGNLNIYKSNAKLVVESTGASDQASIDVKNTSLYARWILDQDDLFRVYNQTSFFDAFAIKSSGNVGIGTTSPNEKLQVAGNINAYVNGGIDAGLFASTSAGSTTIALRSSGITHFNGGNVGIGTTSPGTLLHIDGGHNTARSQITYVHAGDPAHLNSSNLLQWVSEPGITYQGAGIGANINTGGQHYGRYNNSVGYGTYLRFDPVNGYSEFWATTGNSGVAGGQGARVFRVDASGNTRVEGILTVAGASMSVGNTLYLDNNEIWAQNSNSLNVKADADIIIQPSATTAAIFKASGDVGIGTTSPSSKLHISTSTSNPFRIDRVGNVVGIEIAGGASSGWGLYDYARNDFDLWLKNGAVGIGTASVTSGYKLDVRGDILAYYANVVSQGVATGYGITEQRFGPDGGTGTAKPFKVYSNGGFTNEVFQVDTSGTTILTKYGAGNKIGSGNPAYALAVDASGNIIETAVQSVPTGGSGTDNYIAKWVSTSELGNSNIFDDGTNVGIGTAVPAAPLSVFGTGGTVFDVQGSQGQLFSITDSLTGSLMSVNDISGLPILEVFDTDKVVMGEFGTNALVVTGSNVGIGTDTPTQKLDVLDGKIQISNTVSGRTSTIGMDDNYNFYIKNTNQGNLYLGNGTNVFVSGNLNADSGTLYVNASTNNVGIGTTSPTTKFHVAGGVLIGDVYQQPAGSVWDTSNSQLILGGTHNTGFNQNTRAKLVISGYDNDGSTIYPILVEDENGQKDFWLKNRASQTSVPVAYFAGNVGIGTTSPASPLHVNTGTGTGTANTVIIDRAGASDYSGISFATAGTVDWSIGHNSAGNFEVFENGADATTRFTIETGGNVGIGTVNPAYKIHGQANAATWGYRFENNTGDQDVHTFLSHGGGYGIAVDSTSNSSSTYLLKLAGGTGGTGIGSVERFRVTSAGYVGIANSSPQYHLDVAGAAEFQDYIRVTNTGGAQRILLGNQDSAGVNNPSIITAANGTTYIGGGSTWTGNGGTLDYTATFTDGGNVGINTTSPTEKLDVQGNIKWGTSTFGGTLAYGTGNASITATANTELLIGANGNANDIKITTAGNVGIGTASPAYKLDVNGNVRFTADEIYLSGPSVTRFRSNNEVFFLTNGGSAQNSRHNGIQVSSNYSGAVPANGILFHTDNQLQRVAADQLTYSTTGGAGAFTPGANPGYFLGLDSRRWEIVFCNILDSAGLHEKNLENPEGEKSVGDYATGTVLVWKGGKNVPCSIEADHMRMGIAVEGMASPLVQGAEPVLCTGVVNEGDYIITSDKEGHAKGISRQEMLERNLFDCVLGKALETGEGESYLLKVWITI